MNLSHLEYFCCAAEMGNFTKAAEHLYISQPALSNAIQKLELELGCPLFDRSGKKYVLSEYGEIFLRHSKLVLAELGACRDEIRRLQSEKSIAVQMMSPPMSSFPGLLDRLLALCPNLTVRQTRNQPQELRQLFEQEEVDLCITSYDLSIPEVNRKTLSKEAMVCLLHRSHPLAAREMIDPSELRDVPLAVIGQGTGIYHTIELIFSKVDFSPRINIEAPNYADVLQYVASGRYITMISAKAFERYAQSHSIEQFVTRPLLSELAEVSRYLYWKPKKNRYLISDMAETIEHYFAKEQQ